MAPDVSIIIPVWNQWAFTRRCLETLLSHTPMERVEVIIINNGSQDETATALSEMGGPWLVHHNAQNIGFARACNQGAGLANAPVVLFLNNDTEPHAGWLPPLLRALEENPAAALVGSVLIFPSGLIQHAGVALAYGLGYPLSAYHLLQGEPMDACPKQRHACSAVTAACVAVRADAFAALAGFDEGYINGYEDVDLCLRARAAGYEVLLEPASVLTHVTSASEGRFAQEQHNIDRFHARWLGHISNFDADLRTDLRAATPVRSNEGRPGITVVSLVLPGVLSTLAPWLETTKATLGLQDTWLIINAGADVTSRRYAQWFVKDAQARWIADPQDLHTAWLAALRLAETPYLAFVAPLCLPSWHWLSRAHAHLQGTPSLGLVAAGLPSLGTVGSVLEALDSSVMDTALAAVVKGRCEASYVPETLCFVALTQALKATQLSPARSHDFATALERHSFTMATALDLTARRLAAPARPAHLLEGISQMLLAQAANLAWEAIFVHEQASARSQAAGAITRRYGKAPQTDLVSIVVPVFNQPLLTEAFLTSLYAHTQRDFEVILVDNGSGPEVAHVANSFAQRYGNLVLVRNERNEGFGYACNQGLLRSTGSHVLIINNDVQVASGWLSRMLAVFESDPGIGVVGPMTNRCVGLQQVQPPPYAQANEFPRFAAARAVTHRGGTLNVGRLVGLCLLIKAEVIKRIGGFDPIYGYGNFEDDDFCLRARRAGFRLAVAEDVLLHHEGSATFTGAGFDARALAQQNWELFCHKWGHDMANNQFQQLEALAIEHPFDEECDVVPLDFFEQFRAGSDPLPLATDRALRFMMVPDLDRDDWLGCVQTFLNTFTATSPVALVVRAHPPTPERQRRIVEKVSTLLNGLAQPEAAPQVVLEASWLAPRSRMRLYAAMCACIRTPGAHEPFIERECEATRLPIIDASEDALLGFVNTSTGLHVVQAVTST